MDTDRNENFRVTTWGLFFNLALGVAKCICGWLFQSRALVADGLHSLVDLSTDLAVLFGLKMSSVPEDYDHPYGHHKFASLANLFIAVMLVGFCILLLGNGLMAFHRGTVVRPEWPALVLAVVSLLVKEAMFQWTRQTAVRNHSRLLLTNAWHHRTDSLTSLGVAGAILGTLVLGEEWAFLDSLAAVVIGVYLLIEGARLLRRASNDLLDAAPEDAIINDLREHVLPTPGALAYHSFRARRVGDQIEVDLHLQVEPGLRIDDGHEIARQVRANILRRHPEVIEVLVHVEPASEPHLKQQGVFDFHQDLENPPGPRES